jgi:hypothetical protein
MANTHVDKWQIWSFFTVLHRTRSEAGSVAVWIWERPYDFITCCTTAPATFLQFSEAESASQAGHCKCNICNHKFTVLAEFGLWSILGNTHSKIQRKEKTTNTYLRR